MHDDHALRQVGHAWTVGSGACGHAGNRRRAASAGQVGRTGRGPTEGSVAEAGGNQANGRRAIRRQANARQAADSRGAGHQAAREQTAGRRAKRPVDPADAAAKKKILDSYEWHRAMFELTEWLSAQSIYSKQQVAQIEADFNRQVAEMSGVELSFVLADMQEKFKIMESSEAKEARNWVGRYLSILTEKKRAQVLKDVPNLLTMTAAQLEQEIMKIDRRRDSMRSNQAAFDRTRQEQVSNQIQQDRFEQQTYVQNRANFPTDADTYSPYRNGPVRSINSLRPASQGMGYYVGAYGGFGMTINPSSW